jgi:hypothetical protein
MGLSTLYHVTANTVSRGGDAYETRSYDCTQPYSSEVYKYIHVIIKRHKNAFSMSLYMCLSSIRHDFLFKLNTAVAPNTKFTKLLQPWPKATSCRESTPVPVSAVNFSPR